jgi:hypothetical protein
MVEATHIKKEEEADVNLVAISCVLCDVRIYTETVDENKITKLLQKVQVIDL